MKGFSHCEYFKMYMTIYSKTMTLICGFYNVYRCNIHNTYGIKYSGRSECIYTTVNISICYVK